MNASHAAALMTAGQYRAEAVKMLENATETMRQQAMRDSFIACAQVYALLAISAQAAENANDTPF